MPSPPQGYRNAKGERVPSVTSIIGRWKDSGALIAWSNKIAYEPYRQARALIERIVEIGMVSPAILADCKTLLSKAPDHCDYRTARDSAASIGTIVHARVDSFIRGVECDLRQYVSESIPDPVGASESGFQAFLEWSTSSSFDLAEGEVQLVSNCYDYGGTPDVIIVKGEKLVGDFKTGDLYPEQVLPQLAAYRQLLIENGREVGQGGHAVSINRKTGGFNHRYFVPAEMIQGWNVFLKMRELYSLIKELK